MPQKTALLGIHIHPKQSGIYIIYHAPSTAGVARQSPPPRRSDTAGQPRTTRSCAAAFSSKHSRASCGSLRPMALQVMTGTWLQPSMQRNISRPLALAASRRAYGGTPSFMPALTPVQAHMHIRRSRARA